MKKAQLDTPILFMTFNRPNEAKKVFREIRKARPKKLFFSSDGPRNKNEKKYVEKTRKYVLKNVDWKCEVKTLLRDKNLGCKNACSGAINWFFDNVDRGIILEDDCLPSQSFFIFCQEMLEKYKDEEKIAHISGTNIDGISEINSSYFFSSISNMWGWASWKRAWKIYDVDMKEWPKYNSYFGMGKLGYNGLFLRIKALRLFRLTYSGKIDTWDYQWDLISRAKRKLSIVPKVNMIKNIGVGGGTHTINYGEEKSYKTYKLNFPLKHPVKIIEDRDYFDRYVKRYSVSFFDKGIEMLIYWTKRYLLKQ
jgi:hypothetical protein